MVLTRFPLPHNCWVKTQVAVGETDDPGFIAVLNSLVQGLISNRAPEKLSGRSAKVFSGVSGLCHCVTLSDVSGRVQESIRVVSGWRNIPHCIHDGQEGKSHLLPFANVMDIWPA